MIIGSNGKIVFLKHLRSIFELTLFISELKKGLHLNSRDAEYPVLEQTISHLPPSSIQGTLKMLLA